MGPVRRGGKCASKWRLVPLEGDELASQVECGAERELAQESGSHIAFKLMPSCPTGLFLSWRRPSGACFYPDAPKRSGATACAVAPRSGCFCDEVELPQGFLGLNELHETLGCQFVNAPLGLSFHALTCSV